MTVRRCAPRVSRLVRIVSYPFVINRDGRKRFGDPYVEEFGPAGFISRGWPMLGPWPLFTNVTSYSTGVFDHPLFEIYCIHYDPGASLLVTEIAFPKHGELIARAVDIIFRGKKRRDELWNISYVAMERVDTYLELRESINLSSTCRYFLSKCMLKFFVDFKHLSSRNPDKMADNESMKTLINSVKCTPRQRWVMSRLLDRDCRTRYEAYILGSIGAEFYVMSQHWTGLGANSYRLMRSRKTWDKKCTNFTARRVSYKKRPYKTIGALCNPARVTRVRAERVRTEYEARKYEAAGDVMYEYARETRLTNSRLNWALSDCDRKKNVRDHNVELDIKYADAYNAIGIPEIYDEQIDPEKLLVEMDWTDQCVGTNSWLGPQGGDPSTDRYSLVEEVPQVELSNAFL